VCVCVCVCVCVSATGLLDGCAHPDAQGRLPHPRQDCAGSVLHLAFPVFSLTSLPRTQKRTHTHTPASIHTHAHTHAHTHTHTPACHIPRRRVAADRPAHAGDPQANQTLDRWDCSVSLSASLSLSLSLSFFLSLPLVCHGLACLTQFSSSVFHTHTTHTHTQTHTHTHTHTQASS
jgi:hypothetical protein